VYDHPSNNFTLSEVTVYDHPSNDCKLYRKLQCTIIHLMIVNYLKLQC